jgi:hypothetical protein
VNGRDTTRPLQIALHVIQQTRWPGVNGPLESGFATFQSSSQILRIGIVIRDSFAGQVIVSAQYLSRYFLWTTLIAAVVIRRAFIRFSEIPRVLIRKALAEQEDPPVLGSYSDRLRPAERVAWDRGLPVLAESERCPSTPRTRLGETRAYGFAKGF